MKNITFISIILLIVFICIFFGMNIKDHITNQNDQTQKNNRNITYEYDGRHFDERRPLGYIE